MKIGIEDFKFDSAHYTAGITDKCTNIHGHTFTLNVEIEGGEVDEEKGMVLDFGILKNTVREILEDWDHKFLVPENKIGEVKTKGPFNIEIKPVEGNAATTENIARQIAKEIHQELDFPVKVELYEGEKSYAVAKWPGGGCCE